MITVNSSGSAISAGFVSALTADNTEYQARLLYSGTVLDCAITRLTVTKGSCGSADAYTIGNIIGSTLTAELKGLATSVKGKDVEVQIGLKVNNAFEYVTLGYFTVSEAPSNAYSTTITAYGATIARTGDVFTAPQVQSLANIASTIATSASALAGRTITITFDNSIDSSKLITASMLNLSCYQALEILASVCGGYAVDTYDGNIKICRFSDTPNISRDTSTMKSLPVVEESDFGITGVKVIVSEESQDDEGTVVPAVIYPTTPTGEENLILQNQYVTQELYTAYLATLTGYEYRPATVGLTYGDPRIEGVDVLSVTDITSSVYVVPCHLVTHKFDGGFTTEVASAKGTQQANDVASGSNLSQQLSGMSANVASARASAETAKASAEEANTYARQAKAITDDIEDYAEEVGKTVKQILEDGETAGTMAQQAFESAGIASASASSAIEHLSVVEDIVGVLDMLATNGVYAISQDVEVQPNKWYFTLTGTAVSNPTGNPHAQGWYELSSGVYSLTEDTTVTSGKTYYTVVASAVINPIDADIGTYYELVSIDDTIQNFVSSHLALSKEGLSLQTSEGKESTRVLLSTTEGLVLYNENGIRVASYGTDAVIGNINTYGIKIGSSPDYVLTTDSAIIAGKTYYTRSGSGTTADPYVYTEVANPVVADIGTYYENVKEIGFYQGGNRVAYISGSKLYITQSVVLQQMDVGTKVADGGLGQWSWKVHEVGGANNLYLKWLG